MLELYVMKVTRTVLRRERGSNLSDLADPYDEREVKTSIQCPDCGGELLYCPRICKQ